LRKKLRAVSDICGKLRFEPVSGIKRFQFLLFEHRFFEDGEDGTALPLSLPRLLFPLSLVVHVAKTRALTLLRLSCYFVKFEAKTVGLLAFEERHESLIVASLAVAKEYRRLGIGTCILGHIETIAKHMGKRWLEVDVFKKNVPAQRFYAKYGFAFIKSKRMLLTMRKKTRIGY
jgi:ribosomal protein S18 acetylase RimI-like enzyme